MTARGALAALAVPLVMLLAACGGDSGSTAADPTDSTSSESTPPESTDSTEPSEPTSTPLPDWPACAEVWVADSKLPGSYQGCVDGETAVEADNLSCSSGQRLVRHADRFYAVRGGTIHRTKVPLEKDDGYLDTIATCRG